MQDPGFFNSVSSNGSAATPPSNTIVWAVAKPVNTNPANVTLYAFGPQAAAGGHNGWLFSAVAGTWPNVTANAGIVPVVANGRVYVASYKQLAIFGLAPAAGANLAAVQSPVPPAPPALPPDDHEIFGTIKAVAGSSLTLATRTGQLVRVDVADAVVCKGKLRF